MTTAPQIEVTISFLEMLERPHNLNLHSPQGKKTSLIRAYKPTLSFYRYLYNTIGEPWLWWERRTLSDDELLQIIQDENVEIYVLYYDGVPAGYAELDRRTPKEIDVPNIVTAVLASYRGYDTLGEVTVVFAAGLGVILLISGMGRRRRKSQSGGQR